MHIFLADHADCEAGRSFSGVRHAVRAHTNFRVSQGKNDELPLPTLKYQLRQQSQAKHPSTRCETSRASLYLPQFVTFSDQFHPVSTYSCIKSSLAAHHGEFISTQLADQQTKHWCTLLAIVHRPFRQPITSNNAVLISSAYQSGRLSVHETCYLRFQPG